MSKKELINILILIILPIAATSQITIKQRLNWHKPHWFYVKNGLDSQKVYYLSFDGALEKTAFRFPVFQAILPVNHFGKANVRIKKINYKPFDTAIYGQKLLPQKIKINSNIYLKRHKPYLVLDFIPIFQRNGKIFLVTDFEIEITITPQKLKNYRFKSSSVLSSGRWVKIGITKTGVYKITFDQLKKLGFDNPRTVRVFGNDFGQLPYDNDQYFPDDLIENKVYYGPDYILFFATDVKRWYFDSETKMFLRVNHDYSDTAYYFLTDKNTGFDNIISQINENDLDPDIITNKYLWYGDFEENDVNVLHSGRIWFNLPLIYGGRTQTYEFQVDSVLPEPAKAKVVFVARSSSTSSMTISCCDDQTTVNIPQLYGHLTWGYLKDAILNFVPNQSQNIQISMSYNAISGSRALVDYIVVNLYRKLTYSNKQLLFTDPNLAKQNTVRFLISNAPEQDFFVWDVTNPRQPKRIQINYYNHSAWFTITMDTIRQFVAFSLNDVLTPILEGEGIGQIRNQNLHGLSPNIDMVIISHPDFIPAAQRIAQLHQQHDGLKVQVVDLEQIYNEYSCGMRDAVAIRNFLRSLYQKENSQLRWVLLLGDGSYNNRPAPNNPLYIPTYQTLNSLNDNGYLSMVSDDFFVMLDPNEGDITPNKNGLCDLNIGRLPVKSLAEAQNMAKKIEYYLYHQDPEPWKNYLVFLADDGSQNIFMNDAENISYNIYNKNPQFRIKKIYIDAYKAEINFGGEEFPGAVTDLKNRVENGSLIISYLGHGNETVLTSERVVTISDVRNWKNLNRLNFFITGTCEFGRFDQYSSKELIITAGEAVVLNPLGGAIALLTTTRLSYSSVNFYVNYGIFDHAFEKIDNRKITIGEIINKAKFDYNSYYIHEFVLLGDPALQLTYPVNKAVVTSISADTLKALAKVRIAGQITDSASKLLDDFNGKVYITVLDKPKYYWTLNNDGVGAFRYLDYKNIIFNGQADVRNGLFSAEFIVPKDVMDDVGTGKILLYATGNQTEAMGVRKIIVGGLADTIITDDKGPEIKLFLNDTNFVNGTITDTQPIVIAYLYDESGINTSAAGLGHELQLILDQQKYTVNDFFIYNPNTYKKGKLQYKLYKLDKGKHTLTLKAFDNLNNYSEKTIEFIVTDDNQIILSNVFNYPNPFVDRTAFYFEHNQASSDVAVIIQIFSATGRLVKTITQDIVSNSFLAGPIYWDGLDDFGQPIARGVYFYILTVKTADGKVAKYKGKLLKI